jgi:hypothetical protein
MGAIPSDIPLPWGKGRSREKKRREKKEEEISNSFVQPMKVSFWKRKKNAALANFRGIWYGT